jgi:hypothetical protein
MKILYSPQRNDNKLVYSFEGEVVTVSYQKPLEQIVNGESHIILTETASDIFDFSSIGDGIMEEIETELPANPILKAKRTDGVLSLELLNFVGSEATDEEKFPQWIEV